MRIRDLLLENEAQKKKISVDKSNYDKTIKVKESEILSMFEERLSLL